MISKKREQFLEKWDEPTIRKKIIYKLLFGLLILIIICPYRFCPSGTFQIQPITGQGIIADLNGRIESVLVKEGDWVKKGDLIAKLSISGMQKGAGTSDGKETGLAEIRSPIDGRIAALYIDKQANYMLEAGDQLASIEDDSKVSVEIYLNESDIGEVKLAMPVIMKTWAYSGRAFTGGKVVEIASAIVNKDAIKSELSDIEQNNDAVRILNNQGEEIARITAEFHNSDKLLKPGMTGYAKIIGRWTLLGNVLTKGIVRFFRVEVWSWLP